MEQKYNNVCKAYTSITKGDKDINVLNNDNQLSDEARLAISKIQVDLNVSFDISYDIMADACSIISGKSLDNNPEDRYSLFYEYLDFLADADSHANVYTAVQLSYLSVDNEDEISQIIKDEAITSIAQACAIWYSQKVAEACEALKEYITSK